jgi:5S rRNA maturation endonuclease (ribonuclease M5)
MGIVGRHMLRKASGDDHRSVRRMVVAAMVDVCGEAMSIKKLVTVRLSIETKTVMLICKCRPT